MIGEGPAYEPETLEELCELVRDSSNVLLRRNDGLIREFRRGHYGRREEDWAQPRPVEPGWTHICSESFREIVEYDMDDQVIRVQADLPLGELQVELEKHGQCIPTPRWQGFNAPWALSESIGTLAAMNLPHGLEAQCGSWRDWIIGMTIVLADGTVAKCGSKAVKNVAGYDAQKFMVGSRDTLGIIFELTLRTFPLKALPEPKIQRWDRDQDEVQWWIQRTSASDWPDALAKGEGKLIAADHASHTLYADQPLTRFSGDWVLRSGCGEENLQITDSTQVKLMKRAKAIFDPTSKLNPGEMGIF